MTRHTAFLLVIVFNLGWMPSFTFGEVTESSFPGVKSQWNGYDRYDYSVDGRDCFVVVPKQAAPGKPWIWRTEFFGHEPQGDLALLAHGFHAVYINVQNMYGSPTAMKHMDAFYDDLTKRGLAKKTVLEGFSRGGLFAFNWAALHPDHVACIYVDAPVCDFKSWPGGKIGQGKGSPDDWKQCLAAYGLSEDEAMAYKQNPIDNLEPLAKAKIPLLHVVGDADTTVPVADNTALLEKRYKALGGPITIISKPGVDHHPHSLVDPKPIVDFILMHAAPQASLQQEK